MTAAAFWWVNTVTVRTLTTRGTYGASYSDPVDVQCWVESGVKMVRNLAGEEVVSSSEIRGPLDNAALFKAGSLVTVAGGTAATVLSVDTFDSGSLGLDLEHFIAYLT